MRAEGDGGHWDHLKQPVRIWLAQSRAEAGKGACSADTAAETACEVGDGSFSEL